MVENATPASGLVDNTTTEIVSDKIAVKAIPFSKISDGVTQLATRQPLDGDLTAIAALATNGVPNKVGTSNWEVLPVTDDTKDFMAADLAGQKAIMASHGQTTVEVTGIATEDLTPYARELTVTTNVSGSGYTYRFNVKATNAMIGDKINFDLRFASGSTATIEIYDDEIGALIYTKVGSSLLHFPVTIYYIGGNWFSLTPA